MLATKLIREHGLRHRMKDPRGFLTQMNGLCMAMTGTRPQAEQVLGRIDNVLLQLPAAIEQAHRRIIQEKAVSNEKKILSLYEPDIRVIVRGKANAEVEFGNSLMICEQRDGIIVNWTLSKGKAPNDSQELRPRIEEITEEYGEGTVKAAVTDCQFDSSGNRDWLNEQKIYNGLCPRNPGTLKEKSGTKKFQKLQKRRAQTEARISILKNGFLGDPMRVKGFENRELRVGWGILTHNLWVIARLKKAEEQERELAKAP